MTLGLNSVYSSKLRSFKSFISTFPHIKLNFNIITIVITIIILVRICLVLCLLISSSVHMFINTSLQIKYLLPAYVLKFR